MPKILYLGTDPSHCTLRGDVVHAPVIEIVPKDEHDSHILKAKEEFHLFTHIVFTSKNAVALFFTLFKEISLSNKRLVSVGKITSKILSEHGYDPDVTAVDECQEGVMELLKCEDLIEAYVFLPSAESARPNLRRFLQKENTPYLFCPIYTTKPRRIDPLPKLDTFDVVVFTSPSCVEAFFLIFSALPSHLKCVAQGEVTKKKL